jgi:dissimilatory sulfite reductase (desulfoviridin) alpha/beta subunit
MTERELTGVGDLELDFTEAELEKAKTPILPGADDSPESTHALTEAPLPSGVALGSRTVFEPILSKADDDAEDERQPRILPPPFLLRLSLEAGSEGQSRVEKVADQAWGLASGQLWPVFVKRFHPTRPIDAATLKGLALAVRKLGDNRLCLGPNGHLDVFFNDRKSLEKLSLEMEGNFPNSQAPAPIKITACRGLLDCPMAAVDTLTAAEKLSEILGGHSWAKVTLRRPPLSLSIAGCQAGQGLGCGLYEYQDLALVGRREGFPLIDQRVAALSPKISLLVSDCPGRAINRSHLPGLIVEINMERCRRCGWCVSVDPAFSWPAPQGGYFSLETSGRRNFPPFEFVPAKTLWPKLPNDWIEVGIRLLELAELWRAEAKEGEIMADFAARRC